MPISVTLSLQGMSCGACSARVDRKLTSLDGLSDVAVNLAAHTARFTLSEGADLGNVEKTLSEMGFAARTGNVTLNIADMSCASCTGRVERGVRNTLGVIDANVNLASNTAQIRYFEGVTDPLALAQVVSAMGYPATPQAHSAPIDITTRTQAEAKTIAKRALIAALLALPVLILEMGSHMVPALHMLIDRTLGQTNSWIVQFMLTSLVMFWPGRVFYTKGLKALRHMAPDMNSLVALGTGAAYGYSVIATFLPNLMPTALRAVYFEAAAVIIVLILIGRWLEARAKGRSGAAIQGLLGLQPRTAHVLRQEQLHKVSIEQLIVGDMLLIKPGERLPVDGVVYDGESLVDESMITGEPIPVTKSKGDIITAGTVNGAANLYVTATHVGSETTLAQIIRMVETAQGSKLPIQSLVDRITLWFVPVIIGLAAVTVATWALIGPSPALSYALLAGVSVLIIACPCAMGLATPTSIMVGTGRAAQMGVLFRKGDALQHLSEIDVIAFDKTGTLTQGHPELSEFITAKGFDRNSLLARIGAMENQSQHPIANAIVQAAKAQGMMFPSIDKITHVTGYGIEAHFDNDSYLVGADRLMHKHGLDLTEWEATESTLAAEGKTVLYAAQNGQIAALIAVSDPIKQTTYAAIHALNARGIQLALITGDKQETADTIARELGISTVIAQVLPDGKVAAIETLKSKGRVAFVGDGINDAPALAFADIGIALGTGTDVAIESADVVLMSGDLGGVVNALSVSRHTLRNIKQNLAWAFGYNVALIPVAAGALYPVFGILLSPILAAAAMGLSSVFVISNALRLRRLRPMINTKDTR